MGMYAIVNATSRIVSTITEADEEWASYWPPGTCILIDGITPPPVTGWLYDDATATFGPNWPVELINAKGTVASAGTNARATTLYSGVQYNSTPTDRGDLAARIMARDLAGDGPTDTRILRRKDGVYSAFVLDDDKALLQAMLARHTACDEVQQTAMNNIATAVTNEDLAALAVASNPTWPSL